MRQLRLRDSKRYAQDHITRKWQSWDSNEEFQSWYSEHLAITPLPREDQVGILALRLPFYETLGKRPRFLEPPPPSL